jgi:hypothetical protein
MKIKAIVSLFIFFLLLLTSCESQFSITQNSVPTAKLIFPVTPSSTLSSEQATEAAVNATFSVDFYKAKQTSLYIKYTEIPATLEAMSVHCKDGFILEMYEDIQMMSNDTWTIFTCSPAPAKSEDKWTPGAVDYGMRYTQITKKDHSQTWIIEHNTFNYSTINRPDALLTPLLWTKDGKYLYLFPNSYPSPSGFSQSAFLFTHINSLYRFNLETGSFELILQRNQFGAFGISPDDQYLVFSERDHPDVIHLRNLENDNDVFTEINEDIIAAGAFIWNSESTKVVFSVGYGKQSNDPHDDLSATAIYVLNPRTMHAQKVMAKDARIFEPYRCSETSLWLDENTICLYAANNEFDSWKSIFTFNIKTGLVKYLRPSP